MKRSRKTTYLVLIGLAAAIAACSPRVVVKHWPEPGKPKRVAIMPFKDAAGSPGSGALVNEAFNSEFLAIAAYELVERAALDEVLKEHQLGTSGIIDESRAVEIGKLLNADSVIIGSITEFQERRALILPPASVAVSLRLVDTRTGVVEWTASHRVGGLKRLFTWVVPVVGVVATVISPTAGEQAQSVARTICKTVPKTAAELAKRPR